MPCHSLWYRYYGSRVLTTRVVAHVSQGEEGDSKVVQKSLYHSAHFFFLPYLQKAIQHCTSTVTAQHRMIDMVLHDLHEN